MDLAFLSPALHTDHNFDIFEVHKNYNCSVRLGPRIYQQQVEEGPSYEKSLKRKSGQRKRRYGPRLRERNKKTHLRQFNDRQKRCKRPQPIPDFFLSGANLVRFGAFCGIRDSRATRCPLRGICHGIYIKSGRRCACRAFTLYPSPLISVAKAAQDHNLSSLFKMKMENDRAPVNS